MTRQELQTELKILTNKIVAEHLVHTEYREQLESINHIATVLAKINDKNTKTLDIEKETMRHKINTSIKKIGQIDTKRTKLRIQIQELTRNIAV